MTNTTRPKFKRNQKPGLFEKSRSPMQERKFVGDFIEFQYGDRHPYGVRGGWKNDPRPILLVFYDELLTYIEGINTNYITDVELKQLLEVLSDMDLNLRRGKMSKTIVDQFYQRVKNRNPKILRGYRKYMRDNITAIWELEPTYRLFLETTTEG